jgi:hypothetical protein
MEEVQNPSNSVCHPPPSEPFRIYYVKCLMACLFSLLRDMKDLWAQECLLTTSAIFCTTTMQKGRQTTTEVQQMIVLGSIAPHTVP